MSTELKKSKKEHGEHTGKEIEKQTSHLTWNMVNIEVEKSKKFSGLCLLKKVTPTMAYIAETKHTSANALIMGGTEAVSATTI